MKKLFLFLIGISAFCYSQNAKDINYKAVIDRSDESSINQWIVVSPKSTQPEVKKLVQKLSKQYQLYSWVSISIFSNAKTALNHDNCSDNEFNRYCLAIINKGGVEYEPGFNKLKK